MPAGIAPDIFVQKFRVLGAGCAAVKPESDVRLAAKISKVIFFLNMLKLH